MTNQHDSFPDMMQEDLGFEVVMRGYSRRQVHDHMVRTRNQIRDLEERLARAIDQAEQGRIELADARRRLAEAPQDYDELGQRLSQILKLAEEEAISKREAAAADAAKVREEAAAESERILNAAQTEAERGVEEARNAAERLLAQAGSDAEETLGAARAESEETLRNARAEADRALTSAQHEAERLVADANAQAEATLASANAEAEATLKAARAEAGDTLAAAQKRAESLDEHTGRRVTFLTDTHTEVMRRLGEMGSVMTDLLRREGEAGPLIDESTVLPPRPATGSADDPGREDGPAVEELESVRVLLDDSEDDPQAADRDAKDGDLLGDEPPSGEVPDRDANADVLDRDANADVPGRDAANGGSADLDAHPRDAFDLDDETFGPASVPAHVGHVGGVQAANDVHRLDDVAHANDTYGANDVHLPYGTHDDGQDATGHVLRIGHHPHDAEAAQDTVEVGGRGDVHRLDDTHQANDHDAPGKGRIRGFFEEHDVQLMEASDQDGRPAHRQ
ncbi:hypothetical protein GCM10022226_01360 [Sphaerisporangium flaviroseum]|uniref:Uncharacterized protein n=1 Tax=Sphaerisporangium flaviroseum TaxID=509199 RepID=A0ABP7H9N2_9ACTN